MKLSYLGLRRLSRILGPLRASGMVPAVVDDVLGRRVESAAQDIGIDVGIDEPQQGAPSRPISYARTRIGGRKTTSNAKEPREIRCRVLAAVAASVVMIADLCRAGQPAMSSKTQAKKCRLYL